MKKAFLKLQLPMLVAAFGLFCFSSFAANPEAQIVVEGGEGGKIKGTIRLTLFADKAPKTVENFIGLAKGTKEWTDPKTDKKMKNKPLYNNTIFHRVIPNFMIQGGDPLGSGRGGPGYVFADEFDPSLKFDKPGILAMANAGPGTNGSQFFITTELTPHLNGRHTIFAKVADEKSMKLVEKISKETTGPGDRPVKDVKIKKIIIKQ